MTFLISYIQCKENSFCVVDANVANSSQWGQYPLFLLSDEENY